MQFIRTKTTTTTIFLLIKLKQTAQVYIKSIKSNYTKQTNKQKNKSYMYVYKFMIDFC